MTAKELSQLYHLNREIDMNYRRLAELEEAATNASSVITGLPHATRLADRTAIAAEIADIKAVIEAKQRLCIVEYNRLNRYVASIDDSLLRQIISLRFINGLRWSDVAENIGGGNTADSVRKACKRFLEI